MLLSRRLATPLTALASGRAFSSTGLARLGQSDLAISDNPDKTEIVRAATELVDNGKWHLSNGGAGLERPFKFKTFKATWVRTPASSLLIASLSAPLRLM